jgi:dihydrofolate synthase/folylpolyglutamate synthase
MTYQETLVYIYGLARFGMRPGLERISAVLRDIGNPHEELQVVHVAGTNGKGSTAAFLSSIATEGGYKVGLFTSPHLIRFTERMRINGVEIPEAAVVRLADRIIKAAPPESTFFEIVTAMAFLYFAEEGVELAIMEAGMGGGLDATNSASGILSLITPISLDHCQYLGESIAAIAREKGGIIKPGQSVVVAVQDADALSILSQRCAELRSPLYCAGAEFSSSWEHQGLTYQGIHARMTGLRPGISGRYQKINAAMALCAAELLTSLGFGLDEPALRRGIDSARWPGRMETFGVSPQFLLDCAHNAAGAEALAESLADIPYSRLFLVVGIMGDKDIAGILAPLLPLADHVFAVSPAIVRALPSDELAAMCRDRGTEAIDAGEVAAGLSLAGTAAGPADLVLVCGSLFTVGEARASLLAQQFEPCRG